jgi:hypothetical protein
MQSTNTRMYAAYLQQQRQLEQGGSGSTRQGAPSRQHVKRRNLSSPALCISTEEFTVHKSGQLNGTCGAASHQQPRLAVLTWLQFATEQAAPRHLAASYL